jgi:hypothetical protein
LRTILWLVLGALIGGIACFLLVSPEIKATDFVSLVLGVVALVLGIVAKEDARTILAMVHDLVSSMARQDVRMDLLARQIDQREAAGGGPVPIPPGVTEVTRKRR